MLTGKFTPSKDAGVLSTAPHFNNPATPITVRFSDSTGLPEIPDTDPNASPRGLAIRFNLGDHIHTDIISHSTPFFPSRTGADFLEFFKSIAASPPGGNSPSPIETYLGSHPAALAFVQAPKPTPSSYAGDTYFSVNAFKFLDRSGKTTYVRYRVIPTTELETPDEASLKVKDADFLQSDLNTRLKEGPITFRLVAQIAEEGDEVNDATVHWPESRRLVDLGVVEVEGILPNNAKEQKHIIFDPIPRVKGIEPSDDPLLEFRAAVYLISGRERRAAP